MTFKILLVLLGLLPRNANFENLHVTCYRPTLRVFSFDAIQPLILDLYTIIYEKSTIRTDWKVCKLERGANTEDKHCTLFEFIILKLSKT